jgi:hypothetical protein
MASSHASARREMGGEALTEGVQARLLSSEITCFGLPTLWSEGEGSTREMGTDLFFANEGNGDRSIFR